MPRIKKRGLDYFPLNTDFMYDRLVRRIMKREGDGAFAILLGTISCIYADKGYYIHIDDLFYEDLAACFYEENAGDIKHILDLAVEYGIFDATLFREYGILTSTDIQKQYLFSTRRRKSSAIDVRYDLISSTQTDEENDNQGDETDGEVSETDSDNASGDSRYNIPADYQNKEPEAESSNIPEGNNNKAFSTDSNTTAEGTHGKVPESENGHFTEEENNRSPGAFRNNAPGNNQSTSSETENGNMPGEAISRTTGTCGNNTSGNNHGKSADYHEDNTSRRRNGVPKQRVRGDENVTFKPQNVTSGTHSIAQHSIAQNSVAYPLLNGSPGEGTEDADETSAEEKYLRKIAGMQPPPDGMKRNYDGLLFNLRQLHIAPHEQYAIILKSNFGIIGHPLWKGFYTLHDSHGRIRQPGRYLLSLCCKRKFSECE